MRRLFTTLCLFPLLSLAADRSDIAWKASLATLAASNAADVATSLACNRNAACGQETNALYGSQFGGRAIGIKVGLVGANVLIQRLVVRRHPKLKGLFTVLNFGQSVGPAIAAGRNAGYR